MAEAGTNVDITWMSGVYAPAGTPREIVTRLNREIARIMQTPETRAVLASMQAEAMARCRPRNSPRTSSARATASARSCAMRIFESIRLLVSSFPVKGKEFFRILIGTVELAIS